MLGYIFELYSGNGNEANIKQLLFPSEKNRSFSLRRTSKKRHQLAWIITKTEE